MSTKRKVDIPVIMLFIVAAIVPIIVRIAFVPLSPEFAQAIMWIHQLEDPIAQDLFSYHKAWVLTACAAIIILYNVSDLIINPLSSQAINKSAKLLLKDPVIILVAVYLFFVLISNIFSPYTHTALWGVYDRREGLFVQFAYMTVFLATLFYVKNDLFNARILIIGLLVSSLIMGAIGFSQFINRDFFSTLFAAWLVTGHWLHLIPQFEMSYGTNFNPNTFGLVTAILFPVLFAAAAWWPKGGRSSVFIRAGLILAGILMAFGVVGSRSVGGFIGASTAFAVIIFTLIVRWLVNLIGKSGRKPLTRGFFISAGVGLFTAIALIAALRGPIQDNLLFTMGRISAIFEPPYQNHLPDITFEGNRITTTQWGVTYHISIPTTPGEPEVTTADGTILEPVISQNPEAPIINYTYEIPGIGTTVINRVNSDSVYYLYRNIVLTVPPDGAVSGHRIYIVDFRTDDLIDPNTSIPSWGFEGWETWGSNRGFIFSRTIPLIPQFIIIGKGSDTFPLVFPTHDIIGNLRYFGNPYMWVDKAHNLYLQTIVTTGLISALVLIGIFSHYIITTFLSLLKSQTDKNFWLRLGILASVSAFTISSLSTDSTVSSTPIFWIIIGIGYALNRGTIERRTDNDRRTT